MQFPLNRKLVQPAIREVVNQPEYVARHRRCKQLATAGSAGY
jgi:hypothetical protein